MDFKVYPDAKQSGINIELSRGGQKNVQFFPILMISEGRQIGRQTGLSYQKLSEICNQIKTLDDVKKIGLEKSVKVNESGEWLK